jgi:hypothetical protein
LRRYILDLTLELRHNQETDLYQLAKCISHQFLKSPQLFWAKKEINKDKRKNYINVIRLFLKVLFIIPDYK